MSNKTLIIIIIHSLQVYYQNLQENLIALMILSSENDILQTIDNKAIIKEFCQTKVRKKLVNYKF